MNCYPEDIVNNMSLTELQNCDWDALFSQIQGSNGYYNNSINNNNPNVRNQITTVRPNSIQTTNNNTIFDRKSLNKANNEKSQDIVIARKPIFIPLGKDNMDACRAIEIHNALFLESEFDFSTVSKIAEEDRGDIFICKICDDTFQTRASLITHVKVHQQPFCVLCLSPFKSVSGYRIHNSKFHNIPWVKEKRNSTTTTTNSTYKQKLNREKSPSPSSSDSTDVESGEEERTPSRNNSYNIYNNLNTITLTSKYGRRRKVLDMTMVMSKKTRKSK